jgi:hypothetical protein
MTDTTEKCFCLACDPKNGEIGRECTRATEKELKLKFPSNPTTGQKHYNDVDGKVYEYQYSGEWTIYPPAPDGLRSADFVGDVRAYVEGYRGGSDVAGFDACVDAEINQRFALQSEKLRVMREALVEIRSTAQAASQHQPEQFCQFAFNAANTALSDGE